MFSFVLTTRSLQKGWVVWGFGGGRGAFGAMTCDSGEQVIMAQPVSGSDVSFASPAVLTQLPLQPVLFGGMVSWTCAPHLQCSPAGTQLSNSASFSFMAVSCFSELLAACAAGQMAAHKYCTAQCVGQDLGTCTVGLCCRVALCT